MCVRRGLADSDGMVGLAGWVGMAVGCILAAAAAAAGCILAVAAAGCIRAAGWECRGPGRIGGIEMGESRLMRRVVGGPGIGLLWGSFALVGSCSDRIGLVGWWWSSFDS